MGRETTLFESAEQKSRSDVSAFFQQLAGQIAEGQIVLRHGQGDITLQIPATLTLEVQVEDEDKGGRGVQRSLELEIKWFE